MVKSPPASAEDMGSISDPGRFYMPRSRVAKRPAPGVLRLFSRVQEQQLLSP